GDHTSSPVSPPTSSPGPSQWEASPPSSQTFTPSPTGSTNGLSPTGSTTVQPPSPNGVGRSYAALGPLTLLAVVLAIFQ
ncbi:hypothetical protein Tco_1240153, partial [Tanacetum coccineum]